MRQKFVDFHPFQKSAIEATMKEFLAAPARSGLFIAPTGTGKTVYAAGVIDRYMEEFEDPFGDPFEVKRPKVLFIAHRDELLEQAQKTLRFVTGDRYKTGKQKAKEIAPANSDVVFASQQTIGTEGGLARLAKMHPHFDLLIIDEAHHATRKNTYGAIREAYAGAHLVGLTATPKRLDKQMLHSDKSTLFDMVFYRYHIFQAWKDRFLCPVREKTIRLPIDLSKVKTRGDDFVESELIQVLKNRPDALQIIVNAYLKEGEGRQAAFFLWDVESAQKCAELLNSAGVRAEAVWGDNTPKGMERRKDILANFAGFKRDNAPLFSEDAQEKRIRAVTNVMVLTEGYDYKALSCVVIARPTKSWGLFFQMVGRALRTDDASGKTDALILNVCAENVGTHNIMRLPAIADLPPNFELRGKPLNEVVEEIMMLQIDVNTMVKPNAPPLEMKDVHLMAKCRDIVSVGQTPEDVRAWTRLKWLDASAMHPDSPTRVFTLATSQDAQATLAEEVNGNYALTMRKGEATAVLQLNTDSLETAFLRSDQKLMADLAFSKERALLDRSAEWNNRPPSKSQVPYLRKLLTELKLPADDVMKFITTQGEASSAIGHCIGVIKKKTQPTAQRAQGDLCLL